MFQKTADCIIKKIIACGKNIQLVYVFKYEIKEFEVSFRAGETASQNSVGHLGNVITLFKTYLFKNAYVCCCTNILWVQSQMKTSLMLSSSYKLGKGINLVSFFELVRKLNFCQSWENWETLLSLLSGGVCVSVCTSVCVCAHNILTSYCLVLWLIGRRVISLCAFLFLYVFIHCNSWWVKPSCNLTSYESLVLCFLSFLITFPRSPFFAGLWVSEYSKAQLLDHSFIYVTRPLFYLCHSLDFFHVHPSPCHLYAEGVHTFFLIYIFLFFIKI